MADASRVERRRDVPGEPARNTLDGGTFKDARISEEGRALLAGGLARLRPEQVHALFSGARFLEAESADLAAWASAFQDRARQIVDRAPCPES
jgi:hypothetical protein